MGSEMKTQSTCPVLNNPEQQLDLPPVPVSSALTGANGERISNIDGYKSYTVEPGDTLSSIARGLQHKGYFSDLSPKQLAHELEQFNNGKQALAVGQEISVPSFRLYMLAGIKLPESAAREQFTPIPGATFGNDSYTVQGNEKLFSVLRSYRDTLPPSGEFRCLRDTSVMTMVAVENHLRREQLIKSGVIGPDDGLPPLKPGDKINLKEIFQMDALRRVVDLLNGEGSQTPDEPTPTPAPRPVPRPGPDKHGREFVDKTDVRDLAIEITNRLRRQEGINVPPDLLMGLVLKESSFDRFAISSVKARGLTQVRDIAAGEVYTKDMQARHGNFRSELLYRPEVSLEVGARYLEKMHRRFGNWDDALAAYNQGPTRWQARLNTSDNPQAESQQLSYVTKINAYREDFSDRYFGTQIAGKR